mgnify:CR=1 FL=1
MNQDKIKAAAAALRQARATRVAIPRISEQFGIQGADEAYAVARCNSVQDIAEGRRVVGKKIGVTSKAVQDMLGGQVDSFFATASPLVNQVRQGQLRLLAITGDFIATILAGHFAGENGRFSF